MNSQPQNLGAALRCARRGWSVFPAHSVIDGVCTCGRKDCSSAGKHPRTARGVKDATADIAVIKTWWKRWPGANIAVATGRGSGLLVLDVDPRNGGVKSLNKLLKGEPVPRTPAVRTGGGGHHLFFDCPDTPLSKSRQSIVPGLDVKGDGGYVILPPSLHKAGKKYVWVYGRTPEKVALAPLPRWLKRQLSSKKARSTGAVGEGTTAEVVEEGRRHDFLVRIAGAIRRQGASQEDVEAALSILNQSRCNPPLPQTEVAQIAQSSGDWTPGFGNGSQYSANRGGIFWNKISKDGIVPTRLTNFPARIIAEIAEDDGAEVRRRYQIEAELLDRRKRFEVEAAQFGSMNWPMEHLGAKAIVSPGMGLRDHARAAIQELSSEIEEQTVYTHAGWREHEGQWIYLHTDGAIGSDGLSTEVRVKLPGCLQSLSLPAPAPVEELKAAIRASLKLLDLTPPRVAFPLYCGIWSSVMGLCDYSLFLAGPTGAGKTELAALHQQHFGAGFNARNLPGSWSSTGNANEGLAFAAKDCLLVIDDFAPTGTRGDLARYYREADRILRAQGNASGRQRMRPDSTLRPVKMPRGLILSTGEDIPRGQSLRARTFVLQLSPDDLEWNGLSECQNNAASGLYASVMSAYLRWLAARYAKRRASLRDGLAEWRAEAAKLRATQTDPRDYRAPAAGIWPLPAVRQRIWE